MGKMTDETELRKRATWNVATIRWLCMQSAINNERCPWPWGNNAVPLVRKNISDPGELPFLLWKSQENLNSLEKAWICAGGIWIEGPVCWIWMRWISGYAEDAQMMCWKWNCYVSNWLLTFSLLKSSNSFKPFFLHCTVFICDNCILIKTCTKLMQNPIQIYLKQY